jgi:V/A-type H+/Na+-transporting ATPase subunit K
MVDIGTGMIALGAGLAIGMSAIGAAMAEQQIGAAAVGAAAEDEKMFGKGLILTVIPESLVIFGFVIAIMLVLQVK